MVYQWRSDNPIDTRNRSEEHTSELQSQSNLVCRLLLEKKNKYNSPPSTPLAFMCSTLRIRPSAPTYSRPTSPPAPSTAPDTTLAAPTPPARPSRASIP